MFAQIAPPLSHLLCRQSIQQKGKTSPQSKWQVSQGEAFIAFKEWLTSAPLLVFADYIKPECTVMAISKVL